MSTRGTDATPQVHATHIPASPEPGDRTVAVRGPAQTALRLYRRPHRPQRGAVAEPDARLYVDLGQRRHHTIVHHAGGLPAALAELAVRTRVTCEPAAIWGQVLVTANEYQALWQDTGQEAHALRAARRRVPQHQQVGALTHWANLSGVEPEGLEVKAGWDLFEDEPYARTHVAVMDRDGHGVVVVLTAVPVNQTTARHGDGRLRPAAPRRSCRCTSGGRHRHRDALSSALVASRETR